MKEKSCLCRACYYGDRNLSISQRKVADGRKNTFSFHPNDMSGKRKNCHSLKVTRSKSVFPDQKISFSVLFPKANGFVVLEKIHNVSFHLRLIQLCAFLLIFLNSEFFCIDTVSSEKTIFLKIYQKILNVKRQLSFSPMPNY